MRDFSSVLQRCFNDRFQILTPIRAALEILCLNGHMGRRFNTETADNIRAISPLFWVEIAKRICRPR